VDEQAQLLEFESPAAFQEPSTGAELPPNWEFSWWNSFEDEALDQLIETGLASNFGLKQFAARIEQAAALARQSGATLYPTMDLGGRYNSEWDGNTGTSESRDRQDSSAVGLDLRWEIDVWGRLSSLRRGERLAYQATVEDWLGARLLYPRQLLRLILK
jgi:outer membrane protein TolC